MPLLRRWYYLVPVAYLAVILWLQPADRMVMPGPDNAPPGYPLRGWATRLVTDDGDTTAYAIRAENAARGRKAGLIGPGLFGRTSGWRYPTRRAEEFEEREGPFEPLPETKREDFERRFTQPAGLTDRYFLEYPPLALYLFELGLVGAPGDNPPDVHPAILDGHQYLVGCHVPDTPAEEVQYRRFRHATRVYAVLMTLAQLGLMLVFDFGFPACPTWLLILPGFLYFTPCRFDVLPALLVMASILAADRRRIAAAGLCLGLAVALKMYPLVLAPILLRFSARSWKDAFVWCGCAAVPLLLSYAAMFATDGIEGATLPLRFQLARDHEPQWCFYGKFLPPGLAFNKQPWSALRTAVPLLTAVGWSLFRPPDVFSLLRRCVFALLAFLTVSVFYSPQWWQWLAVLLVPLCVRHRWLIWAVLFLDLWTYLHFPLIYDMVAAHTYDGGNEPVYLAPIRIVHVWVRAVAWLVLTVALARQEWRACTGRATPSPASAPPVAGP
jgi:hypothetical protein